MNLMVREAGDLERNMPTAPATVHDRGELVRIEGLSVRLPGSQGGVTLVDDLSFTIGKGERVVLVGESGSGKSVTAQALTRLNPRLNVQGRVVFDGRDLLALSDRELDKVRGIKIGMAFQDAMTSLNPIMTIGDQVAETLIVHGVSRAEARKRAVSLLSEIGVARAAERLDSYVHEFSGGMRQRVVLGMALIAEPQLLIADEPTTALDVLIQQQVLDVLDEITSRRALSVLLITHDMGIVASFADRVMVMYSGRLVEDAAVDDLFDRPLHPYTRGLLAAVPRTDRDVEQLAAVPGTPSPPTARPSGCAFHPRCPMATDMCRSVVPLLRSVANRRVACHHAGDIEGKADAA